MRFRFIEDHRGTFPVRVRCEVLEVSPAGYYAWRGRPESRRAAANRELLSEIRRVHLRSRGRYGSPRVHAALRAEGGGRAGRHRVAGLMRQHGIAETRFEEVLRPGDNPALAVAACWEEADAIEARWAEMAPPSDLPAAFVASWRAHEAAAHPSRRAPRDI